MTTQTRSANAAASRGRGAVPHRSQDFDHLSLDELRAYRQQLTEEETRVSYWRRLLHARIDIVRAGTAGLPDRESLRRLLSVERMNAGRAVLLTLVPAPGIPPLPSLGELWDHDPDAGDPAATAALLDRLQEAEAAISAYRRSLHERIDAATAELVARYRERPALVARVLAARDAR